MLYYLAVLSFLHADAAPFRSEMTKKTLENLVLTEYEKKSIITFVRKNVGAWCNGNTWVSKTFVEGSSPSAPAISRFRKESAVFLLLGSFAYKLHIVHNQPERTLLRGNSIICAEATV